MTRCPPYEEYDDMARCTREETKMAIAVGGRRPTIPPFVPSSIAQLIRICWATDQKKRPKFSQVVSDLQQIQSQLLTENEVE